MRQGVECRHVRRNMIPWTFLAYIAAHYVIESKRTQRDGALALDGTTGNNGSRCGTQSQRDHRFVRCIVHPALCLSPLCRPDVSEGSGSGSERRQDGIIQGHFGFQVGAKDRSETFAAPSRYNARPADARYVRWFPMSMELIVLKSADQFARSFFCENSELRSRASGVEISAYLSILIVSLVSHNLCCLYIIYIILIYVSFSQSSIRSIYHL